MEYTSTRNDQGDLRETQTQTTQLRFPAQYVEKVIARNLNKHKLMKHKRNDDRRYETY